MVRKLVWLLLITNISFAQKPDTVKNNLTKVDSIKVLVPDSSKKISFVKRFLKADSIRKANPARKALIRSLVLPGWGQATNKEYWVIPIIYTAATGGVYAYWFANDRYWYYKHYLQQIIYEKKTEIEVEEISGLFNKKTGNIIGPFTKAQIEPAVNSFRRYRDLSVILFAVGWALQAVQANVSAHLKNFDMSDDISLKFEPNIQPSMYGMNMGAKITLKF